MTNKIFNLKIQILNLKSISNDQIFKIEKFEKSIKTQDIGIKIKNLKLIISLALWFFAYLHIAHQTYAQSKSNIIVSPQLIQLDLSYDIPEATYTYTNNTNQTIELALTMQDVKELEERGVPGLVDPNITQDYNFGLSNWARFSSSSIIIPPGESKSVTVFVDKERLTIGGHYGSILAEITQNIDNKKVKLRAILSTLLFVRSGLDSEIERANIVQVSNNSAIFTFPDLVTFRFQNAGNVELTPYGTLTIKDVFNNEVGKGIINEDSLITLPDSTRKYVVKMKSISSMHLPGIYKIEVKTRFGKNNISLTESSSFFYIGSTTNILGAVTVLLLLLFPFYLQRKHLK